MNLLSSKFLKINMLTICLLCGFFVFSPVSAQQIEEGEDLLSAIAQRSYLVRMTCVPTFVVVRDDIDVGTIIIPPKVVTATGIAINEYGGVLTTYHTLDSILTSTEIDGVITSCEEENVTIDFFPMDRLSEFSIEKSAIYNEIKSARDDSLRRKDVLFLQADLQGIKSQSYFCSDPNLVDRRSYSNLPVIGAGADAPDEENGRFEFEQVGVNRDLFSSSNYGAGDGVKYLETELPFTQGMSGGPVITKANRQLAGVIHGFSNSSSNPLATTNYLIPLYHFDDLYSDYAGYCHNSAGSAPPARDELIAECKELVYPITDSCKAFDKSGFHSSPSASCSIFLNAQEGYVFASKQVEVISEHYRRISGLPAQQAILPIYGKNDLVTNFKGTIGCSNSAGTGRTCESSAKVRANSYPIKCLPVLTELR